MYYRKFNRIFGQNKFHETDMLVDNKANKFYARARPVYANGILAFIAKSMNENKSK